MTTTQTVPPITPEPGEQWGAVTGHEGTYSVSSHGRVYSHQRLDRQGRNVAGGLLSPTPMITRKGGKPYAIVKLSNNGQSRPRYVHELVLEAHKGPRPPGRVACHWDDDGMNNHVNNLRWGTQSQNKEDYWRNKCEAAATIPFPRASTVREFAAKWEAALQEAEQRQAKIPLNKWAEYHAWEDAGRPVAA